MAHYLPLFMNGDENVDNNELRLRRMHKRLRDASNPFELPIRR